MAALTEITLAGNARVVFETPDYTAAPIAGMPLLRADGRWSRVEYTIAASVVHVPHWMVRESIDHELLRVQRSGAMCVEITLG